MEKRVQLHIIDDEPVCSQLIAGVAEDLGLTARCAASGEAFLAGFSRGDPGIIWLDICLPGRDGLEVMNDLADMGCHNPIILSTGRHHDYLDWATKLGQLRGLEIIAAVPKPLHVPDIKGTLREAIFHGGSGPSNLFPPSQMPC